eukprot:Gb_26293 [translate_table: standard]
MLKWPDYQQKRKIKCDKFSADLFLIQQQEDRSVPLLCNSTLQTNSSTLGSTWQSYCSQVWDACQNASIFNSLFAPSLQGGSPRAPANMMYTKLIELSQSKNDFCTAFGGTTNGEDACFNGTPFVPNVTNDELPPHGVCLEKIGNGVYLNLVPHPDGSNRVFLASKTGQVWLAKLPDENSSGPLELDESSPFIDLSDQIVSDADFGLLGLAFHPDFEKNGRFFASFNCDKKKGSTCLGRCACNPDAGCDPSQLGTDSGAMPCQFHSIIAEYTVNGSSTSPSEAMTANPMEVRRIFMMGLPFRSHHGGQILFGPTDKYLYFMMGDGGNRGDPFNFAQNKKALLGKILRLDVDNMPSTDKENKSLWGNYSIPLDNPFAEDKELIPEIWALGLRNPWRCSFDSLKPTYFICADVGQEGYEEVDLITKGGNYGWRVYEGVNLYTPPWSPGGNTSAGSIHPIFPVLGYDHKSVNPQEGSASITGGYVARSELDPCLFGRYLYADLFGTAMWSAVESPTGSGNFSSTKVAYNCSTKSPMPCTYAAETRNPTLELIYSFAEDNRKNLYMLTANGVYRVVNPRDCNFVCKNDLSTAGPTTDPEESPSPSSSPPSSSSSITLESNDRVWFSFLIIIFMILN